MMYIGLGIVIAVSIVIAGAKIAGELASLTSAIISFRDAYIDQHNKTSKKL